MRQVDLTARYAENMEWARPEKDYFVIGLADFAQKAAGDIMMIELPEVGKTFAQNEVFAVIESNKAATEIFLPLAGTILSVNESLIDHPEHINESPYEQGWIVTIKADNPENFQQLQSPQDYKKSIDDLFRK